MEKYNLIQTSDFSLVYLFIHIFKQARKSPFSQPSAAEKLNRGRKLSTEVKSSIWLDVAP